MADTLEALPKNVDPLLERINKRFDQVDEHFAEQRRYTECACERLEQRMVAGFDRLQGAILATTGRVERMERKLDNFIARQARHRRPGPKPKKQ